MADSGGKTFMAPLCLSTGRIKTRAIHSLFHRFQEAAGIISAGFNTNNFDLGSAVKELYNIELPLICRDVAGSLAVNYDIDAINKEEEQRLSDIRESIHKQISTFTEKPVVFLELESPYFDFEPENIHSLDTLETLYSLSCCLIVLS